MTRRAAIYARQSLDRTGEGLAVDRQLIDTRALCQRSGWDVVGEFVDNDLSASSGRARPEYLRLLDLARAGNVDTIVSWAPDRLARRPRDLEDILDLAERHGLTLATVSGDVDLGTAYGRAVARIFGAIARQESDQKGARQKRANLQRAQAGAGQWSRRPYGLDRAPDGAVTVVDDEAAELRWAAGRVLAGQSLRSLAADLNARNRPTSTGGAWSVRTLRAVLLNPKLSGRVVYRGTDLGPGAWVPILDTTTHDRVRAVLTDPSRRTQHDTRVRFLLSGLALCGRCGGKMFHSSAVGTGDRHWSVYRCREYQHLSRRQDLVDIVVGDMVVEKALDLGAADLFTLDNDRTAELTRTADDLRRRLDQLAELLDDGTLTRASVQRRSAELREELARVESDRGRLTGAPEVRALAAAPDVRARWEQRGPDAMSLATKRVIVDALLTATILPVVKGARFSQDQVQIGWKGDGYAE